MADVPTNVKGRHGFRFDPTINLGHMVSAGVFLVCAGVAYASMYSRVSKLEDAARDLKVRDADIMRDSKDAVVSVETRFMREVTQQRAHRDQT